MVENIEGEDETSMCFQSESVFDEFNKMINMDNLRERVSSRRVDNHGGPRLEG